MANVMKFKSVEVSGANKAEAFENVKEFFALNSKGEVKGDATQAYKNWFAKQQTVTEASKKQFMVEYLEGKKAVPGEAYYITVTAAVKDTRERPWTIVDIKNEEGRRKYKTFHVLKDAETGVELGRVDTTKKDAKDLAKKIIANGFKGKGYSVLEKSVIEGSDKEFTFKYTPSANAKNGTYVVFGITKD